MPDRTLSFGLQNLFTLHRHARREECLWQFPLAYERELLESLVPHPWRDFDIRLKPMLQLDEVIDRDSARAKPFNQVIQDTRRRRPPYFRHPRTVCEKRFVRPEMLTGGFLWGRRLL